MQLDSSLKAQDFFKKHIATDVEEFWIAALNSNLNVIEKKLLFRGTANSCLIHPRDIIRFVCLQNATSFVIAHNHPSGDPRPSTHDIAITKRIFHLSRILEIPLMDHIIISDSKYFSFADNGLLYKFSNLKSLRLRT
jgi:DNA repair protein RadC